MAGLMNSRERVRQHWFTKPDRVADVRRADCRFDCALITNDKLRRPPRWTPESPDTLEAAKSDRGLIRILCTY